ncbi:EI24 domain-containing protein [Cognatishimia activa]|uniref:EI24 domain-containing protein n=1 Tax=Cognatishimia activa TaxID=1715691 RepID=UPI00223265F3|nr:EI24 domain-containing protein [Cognatishimia activa]UZD89830.1 EI24 domain-containing protein [Cognatishimia activa]
MAIGVIFSSFFKALNQMWDPRFRKVFWRGIGLTFALLVGIYILFVSFLFWVGLPDLISSWFDEEVWAGSVVGVGSFVLMMIASVFLMVPVASAITSMFLDQVADAVEDKHYPSLPEAPSVPLLEAMKDTVSFLGILIIANIFALLIYFGLPPLAPFVFWGLNGFLLGREYFTLVAMRRVGRTGAKELRRQHFATIWAAGVLMAVPLSIPLVNLLVPILGAATFTHVYHRLRRGEQIA